MLGGEFAGPVQDPAAGDQARRVQVHQQGPRLAEGGEQVVLGLEGTAGVRHQPLAVGRQRDVPGRPHEQLGAQLPLQPPYVPAQRLLGDVQTGRGAREVQLVRHGEEGAQEAGVEVGGGGSGHAGEFTARASLTTQVRESVPNRCWTP